jgi:aspartate carbamoyltransferase regulatory subunit
MTIYYLYVKTHNKTGLKYLGFTKQKDPHKYTGSGVYWKNHLKVHGADYTTEILKECNNTQEIKEYGLFYSNLWDVVESAEWANLKLEEGDGGFKLTPEIIAKRKQTRRINGNLNTNTPESIAKGIATKKLNGTFGKGYSTSESANRAVETRIKNNNHRQTQASIVKMLETKQKNGTLNVSTPESIAKGIETKKINGTLNSRTPENIMKQVNTRKENGFRQSQESIEQMMKTKKEKGSGIYEKLTCPYCKKIAGKPQFTRWHGDSCKLKSV